MNAFGVGSTAMAFALRTGLIPLTVPKTVRILVHGDAKGVLSPKDLVLHLSSTTNRNFDRRMGSLGPVYLVSRRSLPRRPSPAG